MRTDFTKAINAQQPCFGMPRLFDNLVILKIGTKECNRHAPDTEVDMVGELTQFLVQTLQILDK
jgi:hypothetical protein